MSENNKEYIRPAKIDSTGEICEADILNETLYYQGVEYSIFPDMAGDFHVYIDGKAVYITILLK